MDFDERMKNYEKPYQQVITPNSWTIIRLDGRAFHSLSRRLRLSKPFDDIFMEEMDRVGEAVAKEVMNFRLGFIQSDEISLVLKTRRWESEEWFGGKVQKMTSVSAGIASNEFSFNGVFDSRVFTLPCREEVVNYLIWRQEDWVRNSVQMVARSLYSQKQLHGKGQEAMKEMIKERGQNWDTLEEKYKYGRVIVDNSPPMVTCIPEIKSGRFKDDKEAIREMLGE